MFLGGIFMKKLLEKLNKIRLEIDVDKTKESNGRYRAFTVATVNAQINPLLEKYKIGVAFDVKEYQIAVANKITNTEVIASRNVTIVKERNTFMIQGKVCYTISDLESGEKLEVNTPFLGLNEEGDPAKSQGNAHSYSYKYLWVTLLGLTDVESDPDSANRLQQTQQIEQKLFYYDTSSIEQNQEFVGFVKKLTDSKSAVFGSNIISSKAEIKKLKAFQIPQEAALRIIKQNKNGGTNE